jgi:hypothetical protein
MPTYRARKNRELEFAEELILLGGNYEFSYVLYFDSFFSKHNVPSFPGVNPVIKGHH